MGNSQTRLAQAHKREVERQKGRGPVPPEIKTDSSLTSTPVDVPGANDGQYGFEPSPLDPTAPASEAYHLPPASYSRPPRLPLPIDEEKVQAPDSPLLSAVKDQGDVPDDELAKQDESRRGSVVSSTLDDEDEDQEPDEFQGYMPDIDPDAPKFPFVVEWRDANPNDKVYVTGTFTLWERKFRLHWK